MTNHLSINIQKVLATMLFFALLTIGQVRAQGSNNDLPCLPSHGESGDVTAWCGTETITQTTQLATGWNWFSAYVEITMNDLKAALLEALPGTSITIKSKNNGFTTYNGTNWKGSLSTIDLTQMYQIQTANACEITLTGLPIDPTEHPVTIYNGSNWIAFPLSQSMTPTNAFAGFAISGDIIRSKNNGFATYTNSWKGGLTNLIPGQGYIYNSVATDSKTLIYPTSAK